jgi:glutamate-1-semialdehyde 2,1-aminomutase
VVAALTTLEQLDDAAYEQLAATTEALAGGMREAAQAAGMAETVRVQSLPGLMTVFFSDRPVRNYQLAKACDTEAYGVWCRTLLELGVYPPASQFEAWFPSLAHGPEQVQKTVEAAHAAFERVQRR